MLYYTQRGAYASFEENVKGIIAPGYLADIIVFSQDLFSIDPMKTHETRVVMTVFNGNVIYQEKSFMDN
jgi:predicted amidohydrolase YtcJ